MQNHYFQKLHCEKRPEFSDQHPQKARHNPPLILGLKSTLFENDLMFISAPEQ